MFIMFGEQLKEMAASFKKGKRARAEISAVAGCIIYTAAHGMLDVTAFNVQTGQLLLFIIAAGIAAVRLERNRAAVQMEKSVYFPQKEQ